MRQLTEEQKIDQQIAQRWRAGYDERERQFGARHGLTRITQNDWPSWMRGPAIAQEDWFDHPRVFRHAASGLLILTLQPYLDADDPWRDYCELGHSVMAFARQHKLRFNLSFIHNFYYSDPPEVKGRVAFVELWKPRK